MPVRQGGLIGLAVWLIAAAGHADEPGDGHVVQRCLARLTGRPVLLSADDFSQPPLVVVRPRAQPHPRRVLRRNRRARIWACMNFRGAISARCPILGRRIIAMRKIRGGNGISITPSERLGSRAGL